MDVKKCLTIAASDCSGGAGIQADIKTFAAHNCYGASVVTSIIAGNLSSITSVYKIPADEVGKQIDAVFEEIEIDAVKLGLLPDADIVDVVAEKLKKYSPKYIVCDPVIEASNGDKLNDDKMINELRDKIFPLSTLVTPNISEAEALVGEKIADADAMKAAAQKLADMGAKAVLITGGHLEKSATDILFNEGNTSLIKAFKVKSENTHGTGSTLSAAVAANLAMNLSMGSAVFKAKDYVTESIRKSFTIGKDLGPLNHFYKTWKSD